MSHASFTGKANVYCLPSDGCSTFLMGRVFSERALGSWEWWPLGSLRLSSAASLPHLIKPNLAIGPCKLPSHRVGQFGFLPAGACCHWAYVIAASNAITMCFRRQCNCHGRCASWRPHNTAFGIFEGWTVLTHVTSTNMGLVAETFPGLGPGQAGGDSCPPGGGCGSNLAFLFIHR